MMLGRENKRRRGLWTMALTALMMLVLVTGCPRNIPPPENALTDPDELKSAINARLEVIEDARFLNVVLDYFGKGDRVRMRQLLLVKSPDMLRVQTRLPGSDEILSLLVSDGETFALHSRDTNEYFTGAPTRNNINRLLPVDLSAGDLVRVLMGAAPWDRFEREGAGPATLSWDRRTGHYRYAVTTTGGGELSMQVRHGDFAVDSVIELNARGDRIYEYTTRSWERAGPVVLPTYRRFVWPERDLDFSLDVGETQVNVHLQEHLFEFPPPPGSTIIHLDD